MEPSNEAAEVLEVIECINSLRIPETKLDQHHVGDTPSVTIGGGECGGEPKFRGLWVVDDRSRIYVVQGLGTSRHINTLGGAQIMNRLSEGLLLIVESLLLIDAARVNTTVA